MDSVKYVGMDVHKAMTVVAVLDAKGKLRMQSMIETKAEPIRQFIQGLGGTLDVTFEESSYSAWLYDLLAPRVAHLVVCDPRQNALLKSGNKSDRIDARKLADLLRAGLLKAVYHGNHSVRALKELAGSYVNLVQDTTRVMNRLKALYRGRGINCAGQRVYSRTYRGDWLELLREGGVRQRAELLYQQFDALQALRRRARQALLVESRKHPAQKLLRSIPGLGPVRVALLIARVQTPHRFRGKRQLWAYAGLALETRASGEYRLLRGQIERSGKTMLIRGLNPNHNPEMKEIFKGAASAASLRPGPLREFYLSKVAQGMKPQMARLTLARKIAAITLTLWKKGECFDRACLKLQAA